MSILKRNIAANFGGNIWNGLMGLVFVPLYIHFIGIEAYGLMGIFSALLALFSLLDMGLSGTLNRELARLSVQKDKAQDMCDLVRTLEIPYWLIGLLIAVTVVIASPLITNHWIHAKSLPIGTVRTAIILMGLSVAFQWPISLYSGGLMGLQRQVLLSSVNVVIGTSRGLGAVLILWLISPTVEAFFIWQIVVSFVNILLIVFFLWQSLPKGIETPHFRRNVFLNIWRFAAGMTAITILSTILMQMDKLILSRMLSLEMFGYYTLANVVALTLYRFVRPVFSAIYPQLTRFVQLGDDKAIIRLYHKSAQFVSIIILPAALVVAFFSREILRLWTQSPETTEYTYLLVSILTVGTAINCLMNVPYALQLAHGWTRFSIIVNSVSVLLMVPLLILFTKWYGAVGAAYVWLILNTGYMFISLPIMHRRLLTSEKWRWYIVDVGLPCAVALLVAGTLRLTIPLPVNTIALCGCIGMISIVTLSATAIATPITREWIQAQSLKRKTC